MLYNLVKDMYYIKPRSKIYHALDISQALSCYSQDKNLGIEMWTESHFSKKKGIILVHLEADIWDVRSWVKITSFPGAESGGGE